MHEEKENEASLFADEQLLRCAIREQLFFFQQQHFPYAREVTGQLEELCCMQASVQRSWIERMYATFCGVLETNAASLQAVAIFQLGFTRRSLKRLLAQERRQRTPPLNKKRGATRGGMQNK